MSCLFFTWYPSFLLANVQHVLLIFMSWCCLHSIACCLNSRIASFIRPLFNPICSLQHSDATVVGPWIPILPTNLVFKHWSKCWQMHHQFHNLPSTTSHSIPVFSRVNRTFFHSWSMFSPQIRHFSHVFPMFFQDSGTLALDLAMTYASTETEAAKSCFGPYKVRFAVRREQLCMGGGTVKVWKLNIMYNIYIYIYIHI